MHRSSHLHVHVSFWVTLSVINSYSNPPEFLVLIFHWQGDTLKHFYQNYYFEVLIPSEQTVTEFSAIGMLEETDIGRTNPEMKTLKITFSVKSLAHL